MNQSLQVIPIPAFEDNYIWLIHDSKECIIVDPGDALPVISTIESMALNLQAILITHHHSDHINGVSALQTKYPNVATYAPSLERYQFTHTPVAEGDQVSVNFTRNNFNLTLQVIDLPGHTLGHIAYLIDGHPPMKLFCGDTLFGAGCGRLFEGTPAQMLHSLKKLAALPAETLVYCTHEYTAHNIAFALSVEPSNQALIERQYKTKAIRKQNEPSLPSTIGLELLTNPFLRCNEHEIKQSIEQEDASELMTFTTLRSLRNQF